MITSGTVFEEFFSHWVCVTYQTTPESEVRTVSGRALRPANDKRDKDLVMMLQLSLGSSHLFFYPGMILSCELDENRAWMERDTMPQPPSSSHVPWWS